MQYSFYIYNQLKSKQNLKVKFTPWYITTHNLLILSRKVQPPVCNASPGACCPTRPLFRTSAKCQPQQGDNRTSRDANLWVGRFHVPAMGTSAPNLVKHQDRYLFETEARKNEKKNYLKFNFPHSVCLLRQSHKRNPSGWQRQEEGKQVKLKAVAFTEEAAVGD